ncbi:MAG: hypothetical protein JW919_04925 [Candidatus Omnitrophica bacterium]|nr:hypothetical protein [Candidatus Omnitrophota bacterium]
MKTRRGVTLTEVITASVIALYTIGAAYAVYIMVWRWYSEAAPRVEAQRIARAAIAQIVDGYPDDTTGTYTVGTTTYKRRNGIAWATEDPTVTADQIDYQLEPDSSNVRSYYMDTVPDTGGEKALYYKDSNSATHEIRATRGLTDLAFEKFVDGDSVTHNNIITVTATAEKEVRGTRSEPYTIKITYSDIIFLRNTRKGL